MIKCDGGEIIISGTKTDILADIGELFKSLNCMVAFDEEELRHAVDVGFWSDEKLEEECTRVAHEAAHLIGLDKLFGFMTDTSH